MTTCDRTRGRPRCSVRLELCAQNSDWDRIFFGGGPPSRHSDRFIQIPSMNKCANLGAIQNSFSYSKTSFLQGLFSDRTRPGNTSTYPARPLGHPDERQKHRRCLAPPHERCRASLNATDGTILLIYSLLAGTSQRSPKTAQYWPCYA